MDEAQRLARNYDNYVVHPPSECDLLSALQTKMP